MQLSAEEWADPMPGVDFSQRMYAQGPPLCQIEVPRIVNGPSAILVGDEEYWCVTFSCTEYSRNVSPGISFFA